MSAVTHRAPDVHGALSLPSRAVYFDGARAYVTLRIMLQGVSERGFCIR